MAAPANSSVSTERSDIEAYALARRADLVRRAEYDRRIRRQRALMRRRRRARLRRNRILVALAAVVIAVGAFVATGHSGAAPKPAVRMKPHLLSAVGVKSAFVIPGAHPTISWPATGSAAVAVLGEGLLASSPRAPEVPIASLTKLMTAYLVLKDHPLAIGTTGPRFTMTAADVASWVHASQTDESNAPVKLGEVLTEEQLLEALLLPSADNVADLLATWDAGSVPAFVTRMNSTAKTLGLSRTHYADASGVDPGSRSTAGDQAVLAAKLMENPVVRSIVAHPSLPFPVAGTITNYNPALGVDGIIGVKSGFTSNAQGCLAVAAYRSVDGHSALVVTVALSQPNGLYGAASVDEQTLDEAARDLVAYQPIRSGTVVGALVSASGSRAVKVAAPAPVVVGFAGLHFRSGLLFAPHGDVAGMVSFSTRYGTMTQDFVMLAPAKKRAPSHSS